MLPNFIPIFYYFQLFDNNIDEILAYSNQLADA